jgi:hypothetical protein
MTMPAPTLFQNDAANLTRSLLFCRGAPEMVVEQHATLSSLLPAFWACCAACCGQPAASIWIFPPSYWMKDAAAITTPVTNAAVQEKSKNSSRILRIDRPRFLIEGDRTS